LEADMSTFSRRFALAALGAGAALVLAGCSGPYAVSAEVASFGQWPAGRAAGSYAFDRLPSQQQSPRQTQIEDAAKAALAKAGFSPAADPKSADVLVSLGARVTAHELSPWDDPLWWRWRGGLVPLRYSAFYGPGYRGFGPWPGGMLERRFERAVAVLVRDRASGEAIFEAHASNEGATLGDAALTGALFEAALAEFPKSRPESHRVTVQAMR
jgi:Domain of unknown function (DUF4136)